MPTLEKKVELSLGDDVVILSRLFDHQAQFWDCTFKDTETSDYVSSQVQGKGGTGFYLLDRHHERMSIVETIKAIKIMHNKRPKARGIYIENKANGIAVIEMLKKKISGIAPVTPDGGREVRASTVAPLWEAGNIYLPYPLICPQINDFIDELVTFPSTKHDDDVGSMAQLLNKMVSKISLRKGYFDN